MSSKEDREKVELFFMDDPDVLGFCSLLDGGTVGVFLRWSDEGGKETFTEVDGVPIKFLVKGRDF